MRHMTVEDVAKFCKKKVKSDFQLFVGISGETGIGKSVFGLQLAKQCTPNFSLDRNVLYAPTFDQLKEMAEKLPAYNPILLDEAIKIMAKWDWQSRRARELNKYSDVSRVENKIYILCVPRFRDLNEKFRNGNITIWIHLLHRNKETGEGTGVLFSKDWNMFSTDSWNITLNDKLIKIAQSKRRMSEFTLEEKIKVLSKSVNFVAVVHWDNLPDQEYHEYKNHKQLHKYENIQEEKIKPRYERWKRDLYRAITLLREAGWNNFEIAEKMGRHEVDISKIITQENYRQKNYRRKK